MSSPQTPVERFILEYAVFTGDPNSPAGEYTSLNVTAGDAAALLAEFGSAPGTSSDDLVGHYFAQRLDGSVRVTKYRNAAELNQVQQSIHGRHETWLEQSGPPTSHLD